MTDSNKVATQATDELFNHFARISEKANGVDMEVWFANRDAVRARIESDRLALAEKETEIQRLRGLCGEVRDFIEENARLKEGTPILSYISQYGITKKIVDKLDSASKGSDK